jgi:hypothetical protein
MGSPLFNQCIPLSKEPFTHRLEVGTFRFPIAAEGTNSLAISATDLAMLLDGVELDENACRLAFDPRREGAKRERDRSDS